jgi:hypothetical protein
LYIIFSNLPPRAACSAASFLNKLGLKADETSSESFRGKNSEINFLGDMGPRKAVSMPLATNAPWISRGSGLWGRILFRWMGRSPKGREVVIKGRGVVVLVDACSPKGGEDEVMIIGRGVVVLVDACSPKGGEDEEGRDTRRSDVVQILQYIYN